MFKQYKTCHFIKQIYMIKRQMKACRIVYDFIRNITYSLQLCDS